MALAAAPAVAAVLRRRRRGRRGRAHAADGRDLRRALGALHDPGARLRGRRRWGSTRGSSSSSASRRRSPPACCTRRRAPARSAPASRTSRSSRSPRRSRRWPSELDAAAEAAWLTAQGRGVIARAVLAGPGAVRALRAGGAGRIEVVLHGGRYVRLGAEGWLLLAGPRATVGPLSLLVAGLEELPAQPGAPAWVEGEETLVVDGVRIDVAGARPSGRPPGRLRAGEGSRAAASAAVAADRPAPALCAAASAAVAADRPAPALRAAASAAVAADHPAPALGAAASAAVAGDRPAPALRPGLVALRAGRVRHAVGLLAGRGEGLTPAGDDVLTGYSGWVAAAGGPTAPLSVLAAGRASPIGLAYLRCAERGELPGAAAATIDAILAGDPEAAARRARVLRRWGASSGSALLWGIAAGVAERAGFEPANELSPVTRLAGECLQPLGHLSGKGASVKARGRGSPSRFADGPGRSGGGGIRTREGLITPSGFQDHRIQPLCHPSEGPRMFATSAARRDRASPRCRWFAAHGTAKLRHLTAPSAPRPWTAPAGPRPALATARRAVRGSSRAARCRPDPAPTPPRMALETSFKLHEDEPDEQTTIIAVPGEIHVTTAPQFSRAAQRRDRRRQDRRRARPARRRRSSTRPG